MMDAVESRGALLRVLGLALLFLMAMQLSSSAQGVYTVGGRSTAGILGNIANDGGQTSAGLSVGLAHRGWLEPSISFQSGGGSNATALTLSAYPIRIIRLLSKSQREFPMQVSLGTGYLHSSYRGKDIDAATWSGELFCRLGLGAGTFLVPRAAFAHYMRDRYNAVNSVGGMLGMSTRLDGRNDLILEFGLSKVERDQVIVFGIGFVGRNPR